MTAVWSPVSQTGGYWAQFFQTGDEIKRNMMKTCFNKCQDQTGFLPLMGSQRVTAAPFLDGHGHKIPITTAFLTWCFFFGMGIGLSISWKFKFLSTCASKLVFLILHFLPNLLIHLHFVDLKKLKFTPSNNGLVKIHKNKSCQL